MFADMKIGARLALGFGLVMAITLLIGIVGLFNTTFYANQVMHLGANNTKGAAYLADAQSALWQLRWDVAQYIAINDPEQRRKLADNGPVQQRIVEENLARFAETQRTAEELAVLGEVRESFERYMTARPQWFRLYGEGKFEEAAEWRARTITAFGAATVKAFAKLIELQRATSEQAENAVVEQIKKPRNGLIALIAAAMGAGALIAFGITRSITRPLAEAVAVAQHVATGNLAISIEARSRDESGRLLAALGSMRAGLAEAVDTIRQTADGVGTASKQIASGNSEMSSRTEEQAASLEETASSMQQLTTTVKQNAENARQANQLAIGASDVAGRGGQVMGEVIATMGGIAEASSRIADIIAVIDGIAFQTNILALNAAVEAARAGEQGRGFAVVAAEVRVLAQRSASAAREIRDLIQASVERVEGGTRLVEGAGRTMEEIVAAVRRVTDIMSEIALASQEQLSGIEQVGNAVTQMDRMTQQTASLVEESAAAAEHLAAQAERLIDAVARFKLHEANRRAEARAAPPPPPASGLSSRTAPVPRLAHGGALPAHAARA